MGFQKLVVFKGEGTSIDVSRLYGYSFNTINSAKLISMLYQLTYQEVECWQSREPLYKLLVFKPKCNIRHKNCPRIFNPHASEKNYKGATRPHLKML